MACDGVWDVLGNDDVARIVMNNQHLKPDCIAKLIVDLAYTRLSGDNISCIVFDCRE
jgi:serine/threonine protein phosphatase PrpC